MPSSTLLVARRILLALAFAAPFAAAQAQSAPAQPAEPLQNQERADGRRNQKVENLHTEDSGASVDEVRYGGRTQSINVKPKSNMPGYEVLPADAGAARQGSSETGANGPRVWNVMKF
jgi:Ni/Co efflux regulator RcnB